MPVDKIPGYRYELKYLIRNVDVISSAYDVICERKNEFKI